MLYQRNIKLVKNDAFLNINNIHSYSDAGINKCKCDVYFTGILIFIVNHKYSIH